MPLFALNTPSQPPACPQGPRPPGNRLRARQTLLMQPPACPPDPPACIRPRLHQHCTCTTTPTLYLHDYTNIVLAQLHQHCTCTTTPTL
eukprot:359251-Chlamydomonas_euryale.AAC.1